MMYEMEGAVLSVCDDVRDGGCSVVCVMMYEMEGAVLSVRDDVRDVGCCVVCV